MGIRGPVDHISEGQVRSGRLIQLGDGAQLHPMDPTRSSYLDSIFAVNPRLRHRWDYVDWL